MLRGNGAPSIAHRIAASSSTVITHESQSGRDIPIRRPYRSRSGRKRLMNSSQASGELSRIASMRLLSLTRRSARRSRSTARGLVTTHCSRPIQLPPPVSAFLTYEVSSAGQCGCRQRCGPPRRDRSAARGPGRDLCSSRGRDDPHRRERLVDETDSLGEGARPPGRNRRRPDPASPSSLRSTSRIAS